MNPHRPDESRSAESRSAAPDQLSTAPKKALDGIFLTNTIATAVVIISFLHYRLDYVDWLAVSAGVVFCALAAIYLHWRRRRQLRQAAAIKPSTRTLRPRSDFRHPLARELKSPAELTMLLLPTLGLLWLLFQIRTVGADKIKYLLILLSPVILAFGLLIANALQRRVWRWQRCGYDPAHDRFFHEWHSHLGGEVRGAQWPAADFIGIYWEATERWSRFGRGGQLWLAGKEGGEDVRLVELNFWYWDNYRQIQQLAEELATASGLPLLYR